MSKPTSVCDSARPDACARRMDMARPDFGGRRTKKCVTRRPERYAAPLRVGDTFRELKCQNKPENGDLGPLTGRNQEPEIRREETLSNLGEGNDSASRPRLPTHIPSTLLAPPIPQDIFAVICSTGVSRSMLLCYGHGDRSQRRRLNNIKVNRRTQGPSAKAPAQVERSQGLQPASVSLRLYIACL